MNHRRQRPLARDARLGQVSIHPRAHQREQLSERGAGVVFGALPVFAEIGVDAQGDVGTGAHLKHHTTLGNFIDQRQVFNGAHPALGP